MEARIDMIGIITSNFEEMGRFYKDALGFKVKLELDSYLEFENDGARFAISINKVMSDVTKHPSYEEEKKGQSLELAFRVATPQEVDETFEILIGKGATSVTAPADMPWGQRAAFFTNLKQ